MRNPKKTVVLRIGPYTLPTRVVLAPMAGVTDRPFRQLCQRLGAGLTVTEMVSANPQLRHTLKSQRRIDHFGEASPRVVQIAGAEPAMLADFARYNCDHGAQIIDINMGCPAKKVCNQSAGSALLQNELLVACILEAVVAAVPVPVTLKIRTGPSPEQKNGLRIAKIAEAAGIQSLAVHGRTRACAFRGEAEYDTIAEIKAAVSIPVIANGDIDGAEKALRVLKRTGADAVMIGRAAQGNPWIFRDIAHFIEHGEHAPSPTTDEVAATLVEHLSNLHDFYGEYQGVRIARKHLGWYVKRLPGGAAFWQRVSEVDSANVQIAMVRDYFAQSGERLAA
ncbi:MAG: tRNA dihydrouridine synthase DusB [Gammaproteobacteria bacterium]